MCNNYNLYNIVLLCRQSLAVRRLSRSSPSALWCYYYYTRIMMFSVVILRPVCRYRIIISLQVRCATVRLYYTLNDICLDVFFFQEICHCSTALFIYGTHSQSVKRTHYMMQDAKKKKKFVNRKTTVWCSICFRNGFFSTPSANIKLYWQVYIGNIDCSLDKYNTRIIALYLLAADNDKLKKINKSVNRIFKIIFSYHTYFQYRFCT